ncbi:hypothetical protein RRG08_055059 [Elysia crispata]|uniref:Uncharacterized protein n=1 Tax=Elysia crispata TaxID=231223 RepID=A0AAE1AZL4_9GAST|nr:hypothetical protein RRG08_055059 [Elysia crispata]
MTKSCSRRLGQEMLCLDTDTTPDNVLISPPVELESVEDRRCQITRWSNLGLGRTLVPTFPILCCKISESLTLTPISYSSQEVLDLSPVIIDRLHVRQRPIWSGARCTSNMAAVPSVKPWLPSVGSLIIHVSPCLAQAAAGSQDFSPWGPARATSPSRSGSPEMDNVGTVVQP